MSRTIPHRELRNNSSAVLREVQGGETVSITNHGEIVAVLVPPPAPEGPSTLRVRSATRPGGFGEIESVRVARSLQETIDELRGDR